MVDPRNPASPLDAAQLVAEFERAGLRIPRPVSLATTQSTNADATRLAAQGASGWTVVVADCQTAGRGRLDRTWLSEPGTALLCSIILRPPATVPSDRLGWVPLLVGVAAADSLKTLGVPARLKWPNDVVVEAPPSDSATSPTAIGQPDLRKLAGILVERHGHALIVGVGINVIAPLGALPAANATSIEGEIGSAPRREVVLTELLRALDGRWRCWVAANGDAAAGEVAARYLELCSTVGRAVRVQISDRHDLVGDAVGVDPYGRLQVVAADDRLHEVAAGDVVHLR